MGIVKSDWMPKCRMKRVIVHWTAGAHKASNFDRAHYHILIEDDGKLVRGLIPINANARPRKRPYAGHTLDCNTESIGVSVCCMGGASESPFRPGKWPMTKKQWETMAQVVAELCEEYNIPVTPQTVLGHGEVQANLGIKQRQKWDPMVLPWDPSLTKRQVGDAFRTLVAKNLGSSEEEEDVQTVKLVFKGTSVPDVLLVDGGAFVKIRPLATQFGWQITKADGEIIQLQVEGRTIDLECLMIGQSGYVGCRELAVDLGLGIDWKPDENAVYIA
jgi:hypothetical protein